MRFAPEYVALVLHQNFEDAKALFLAPLLAIHRAHLVMLRECGIVSAEEAGRLRAALDAVCESDVQKVVYDGTYEDLFFYVERLLADRCGEDVAGRLHTARSRNDIDMTMYRMRQRGFVLDLVESVLAVRESLLAMAERHTRTVFPAHTHAQPAQPTTVAHYLVGAVEQLERDTVRLKAAYVTTNRSPLGACAITGTGFPIDRHRASALLGFEGPTGNTYGSIATVDYLLESVSAASVALVGLGRLVQDLLLWSTAEVGYLRLADGFVQTSSIMPQKRNPVALEHARALGSRALGQAMGIMVSAHNTPLGDIVDTEDDLQPLVHQAFRDAIRAMTLVGAAMASAELDAERMAGRAAAGGTTLTELADTLVREHHIPFRSSHAIASRFLSVRIADPGLSPGRALARAAESVIGRSIEYSDARIDEILSPRHFVDVRTTHGGPAPAETGRALAASRRLLEEDREWMRRTRAGLADASAALRKATVAL